MTDFNKLETTSDLKKKAEIIGNLLRAAVAMRKYHALKAGPTTR